jgi:hypothetical protein
MCVPCHEHQVECDKASSRTSGASAGAYVLRHVRRRPRPRVMTARVVPSTASPFEEHGTATTAVRIMPDSENGCSTLVTAGRTSVNHAEKGATCFEWGFKALPTVKGTAIAPAYTTSRCRTPLRQAAQAPDAHRPHGRSWSSPKALVTAIEIVAAFAESSLGHRCTCRRKGAGLFEAANRQRRRWHLDYFPGILSSMPLT